MKREEKNPLFTQQQKQQQQQQQQQEQKLISRFVRKLRRGSRLLSSDLRSAAFVSKVFHFRAV